MMNKFKIGDLVSWKSQSYGSITKKEVTYPLTKSPTLNLFIV